MTAASREQVSADIAVALVVVLAVLGLVQLAKDGSFWIDEASVAASLRELPPGELLGPLVGHQSFPRWLLLAIQGMVAAFGDRTIVARALPQLFYLLGSAAWARLLYLRFRDAPLLVVVGGLLLLIPTTWVVYGAMLKPYSFDVFVAAIPFLLDDAFYDRALAPGATAGGRARLVALTVPVALSYPYAMVLLARAAGWWLRRAANGRPALSFASTTAGVAGLAVFAGSLWWTDLRHTRDIAESLQTMWGPCILGHARANTLEVIDRFAVGWWRGATEFSPHARLPAALLLLLRGAIVAGLVSSVAGLRRPAPAGWGSRSAGCATLLLALPVASRVAGYPICAGRLMLFALLPLVVIALEGFAGAATLLRTRRFGSQIALGLGVALVLALAPTSLRETAERARAPAPTDLRPLIAMTRKRPSLPILTNRCTQKEVDALPEGLPAKVLRLERGGSLQVALSESREAWLLVVPSPYCAKGIRRVLLASDRVEQFHAEGADAWLFQVRIALPEPQQRPGELPPEP